MSITRIITMCSVALLSFGSQAFESAVTPHAMIYVSIPLDGPAPGHDRLNYGFRLDSVPYTPGESIDYQRQLQRTAVLDFRMDERGMDGLYLSGIDYLKLYRASRQNDEGGGMEADEGAADAGAGKQTEMDAEPTTGERVRGVFAGMRATAPMGVWIGIGLGVGLLLGVDD